ncbi:hypothetical protein RIF29_29070 [Crotalaria pallida]|uniref:Splicing factor Cactin C-terminal domain-containing protein n=1 Tax=Crotalaria pallida TaxID=3830 RepID=A0AAN9HX49_CROPI
MGCKNKSSRKISEEEIAHYVAKKKAMKVAKKLQKTTGTVLFVWKKKIERDVVNVSVPIDEFFSIEAEKRRHRERMGEIEKLKKRRDERAIEKAHREEEMALLARERAHSLSLELLHGDEKVEEPKKQVQVAAIASKPEDNFEIMAMKAMGAMEDGDAVFGSVAEVNLELPVYWWHEKYKPRKPKYFNRFHTGYEWNKHSRTHYDRDNPPPKVVKGYKFNIFYPDQVDKSKSPTYTIEKDNGSNGDETCIIRFQAGPPYIDIAFRIANEEWEYSQKKGFKCTFEQGVLKVYFNLKRYRYRRITPSSNVSSELELYPFIVIEFKEEYTSKFDKVELDKIVDVVFELSDQALDPAIKEAFDVAYSNIYAFHVAQKSLEKSVENMGGFVFSAYHGRHLLWRISCIIRVENNIGCDDGQWLWVMVGEELLFGGTIVRTGCGHWLLDGKDDDAFP